MRLLAKIFGEDVKKKLFPFIVDSSVNVLSQNLLDKVEWNVPEKHVEPSSKLFDSWHKIPGAHKWHHYFSIYDKIFRDYTEKPLKVLEIGVYKGASIQMWKEYFHADTIIVGVDIDPSCKQFEKESENVFVRIGSQDDEDFLKSISSEFGKFDIIIDDGSHITSHMVASFNYLFAHTLQNKGIYFVEDTHSNYWESHRNTDKSFVDMAKSLVDIMHYHYTIGVREIDYRLGSEAQIKVFSVPKLTTMIEEIRFFDSIIVFYKNDSLKVPVSEHL